MRWSESITYMSCSLVYEYTAKRTAVSMAQTRNRAEEYTIESWSCRLYITIMYGEAILKHWDVLYYQK